MHHVHAKPLWAPYKMKNCACASTALSRAGQAQAETRVWRGTAGHRRASLQEPGDDLHARLETKIYSGAPTESLFEGACGARTIPALLQNRFSKMLVAPTTLWRSFRIVLRGCLWCRNYSGAGLVQVRCRSSAGPVQVRP